MAMFHHGTTGSGIAPFAGALLLGASALPVVASSYGSGIESSQWFLSESVFECSLIQDVPGYGRAVFSHRAGEELAFHLEASLPVMRPGKGSLVVEAPAWRPGVPPRPVGTVTASAGRRSGGVGNRGAALLAQVL